jgi:hypothetical protein
MPETGCDGCHRPLGTSGIETIHPGYALDCVDCHGGDELARDRSTAHVQHDGPKSLRALSASELDGIDPEYVRFVNPSDYRVVDRSCGAGSPYGGEGGCHQEIIDRSKRSVHATLAGQTAIPRYNGGLETSRLARYGVVAVDGAASGEPRGWDVVDRLERLPPPDDLTTKGAGDLQAFHAASILKGCPSCHLGVFGGGLDPANRGNFRSTGCAACHVVYAEDGRSKSGDPVIDHSYPAHPEAHVLTSAIPDYQCEHCHYRGNRVGPAYKGWRERPGRSRDTNVEGSERNASPIHTRPEGFFIIDEDTTNDHDETPPDIHFQRGVACVDCHQARDVHGDGYIHTTMDLEMGIECVDCHGTFDAPIAERDGTFRTSAGDVLRNVSRREGRLSMRSLVDGTEHPLTQIVALEQNAALDEAHDEDKHGELECYACHTAWSMNCYGCHMTVDLRSSSTNPLDGKSTPGKVSGSQDVVTLENLHLGINSDGKIGILMVQNLFQTVIVPCVGSSTTACDVDADSLLPGRRLISSQARYSSDGRIAFSWGPAMPHTTASARTVQPCDRCHPREDGSNLDRVRVTYGFGNGEYTMRDGQSGIEHDLTRAIDERGEPVVSFAHPGAGPVPFERIERALRARVE